MIFQLALKNILAKKSSLVIMLFIAFAIMLLFVTNAVFDCTEHGIEETFEESFTGDIVIRPVSQTPLSLFGDLTPVTGELSDIPVLVPYTELKSYLSSLNVFSFVIPQISGNAAIESGSARIPAFLFGVDGDLYDRSMDGVVVMQGRPFAGEEKGAMLSAAMARQLNVNAGDTVQFIIADGMSFKIRAVPVTAVYDYRVQNDTLSRIALVDAGTLRDLKSISDTKDAGQITLSSEQESLLDGLEFDDDFFGGYEDTEQVVLSDEAVVKDESEQTSAGLLQDAVPASESTSWNFLVCELEKPALKRRVLHQLNRSFKERGWPVQAVDWRTAAGNTAMYLYFMRLILNAGIIIVLAAGFIVVNNTLVINILNRLREIGTMRAIGATRRYVSAECMLETFMLSFAAGVIGCVLGAAASAGISTAHITISNVFLMQLFGGGTIQTLVSFSNIVRSMALALGIGMIAWIYPVRTALSIQPVQAMQGAV